MIGREEETERVGEGVEEIAGEAEAAGVLGGGKDEFNDGAGGGGGVKGVEELAPEGTVEAEDEVRGGERERSILVSFEGVERKGRRTHPDR